MSSLIYVEVLDALKSPGECFLCSLEKDLEQKYAEHYLYELVMDPASREAVVASRGFCNHHTYVMMNEVAKPKTTDGQGMALVMESVNQALIEDIEAQSKNLGKGIRPQLSLSGARLSLRHLRLHVSGPKGDSPHVLKEDVERMISSRRNCPACRHVDYFVKRYADTLVEELSDGDQRIVEPFKASKGLCIPHYSTVMCSLDERVPSLRKESATMQVADVQLRSMRQLGVELREFVRKHDYRSANEPWGVERDAVPRGVLKLSGKRGIKAMLEWDGQNVEPSIEEKPVVSGNPASMDNVSETVRLKAENKFLESKKNELTAQMMSKDSEYTALHFKAHEYFEDNRALTMQLSGLRAENTRLRAILAKNGLIQQPSEISQEENKEKELREKYLFQSRKTES